MLVLLTNIFTRLCGDPYRYSPLPACVTQSSSYHTLLFANGNLNTFEIYTTTKQNPHTATNGPITTTSLNLIMTESEIQTILMKANGCVESECAISDVDDLISELKDQQRVLNARLETIMNVVAHLQAANSSGEQRKTDDVRNIVKDMLRVFTTVVRFFFLYLDYVFFVCLFVMFITLEYVQIGHCFYTYIDHI